MLTIEMLIGAAMAFLGFIVGYITARLTERE